MTLARTLFGLIITTAAAASLAVEPIMLRFPSLLPRPTDESLTYEATCGTTAYKLLVSRNPGVMTLIATGRPNVDLTNTPLGSAILDNAMYSQVAFNCPRDAINIFLAALVVQDGVASGVRYIASVQSNGQIGNSGPIKESLGYFSRTRE